MTSKESFSQEEWASLVMAGTWVGHAIIIADKPRRVRREFKALRNAFELAAKNYPGNGLIGAVLLEAKAAALVEIDPKAMFAKKEENLQRIMANLHGTSMALKKVEGREGIDFRRWVLNIGELTALAVRDEEFAMIGMPGDEISRLERRVLRTVANELGLIPYTVDVEPVKK